MYFLPWLSMFIPTRPLPRVTSSVSQPTIRMWLPNGPSTVMELEWSQRKNLVKHISGSILPSLFLCRACRTSHSPVNTHPQSSSFVRLWMDGILSFDHPQTHPRVLYDDSKDFTTLYRPFIILWASSWPPTSGWQRPHQPTKRYPRYLAVR